MQLKKFTVKTPASSANLGSGFDCFALALSQYDLVHVQIHQETKLQITVTGENSDKIPTDESHLIVKVIDYVLAKYKVTRPGLSLECVNTIPHGRGMGSSGAAIVAGIQIAAEILKPQINLSKNDMLDYATELEGHPDNVAASIFGGVTLAWASGDLGQGKPQIIGLDAHPTIKTTICIPNYQLATKQARNLQPKQLPLADASFNLARSALLSLAITKYPEHLFEATADKIHQDYRSSAMKPSADLMRELRAENIAAVISGAGPCVLVFGSENTQDKQKEILSKLDKSIWQVSSLNISKNGVIIE